jgi:hypothetical protein
MEQAMIITLTSHKGEHYTFIRQAEIYVDHIDFTYFAQHKAKKADLSHFTISTEEFYKIEKALKEAGR